MQGRTGKQKAQSMTNQHTSPQDALALLEEAWGYYTPEQRPAVESPAYDDELLAA